MRDFEDHEVRIVVNTVRDIAEQYRDTQQLRSRIADVMIPLLKKGIVPHTHASPVQKKSNLPQIRFTAFAGFQYKKGTFAGMNGWPQGWAIAAETKGVSPIVMDLVINGDVYIGGVLHEELSQERRAIMAVAKTYLEGKKCR